MNGAPNPFRRLAPEPFSWEYFGCLKSELTGLPIRVIITPHLALFAYLFVARQPHDLHKKQERGSGSFFAPKLRDPLRLASRVAFDGRPSRQDKISARP